MDKLLNVSRSQTVGSPGSGVWSQAFYLFPQSDEIRATKGEAFGVIEISAPEIFDSATCGREVITTLNDEYFKSPESSVLLALKEVLRLSKERVEGIAYAKMAGAAGLDFNLIVGVLWGDILYLARLGNCSAYILRGSKLGCLLGGESETSGTTIETTSGVVGNGDLLTLGTLPFFKEINLADLKNFLELPTVNEISEAIAPRIKGTTDSAGVAATFLNFKFTMVPSVEEEAVNFAEVGEMPKKDSFGKLASTFGSTTVFLKSLIDKFKNGLSFLGRKLGGIKLGFSKSYPARSGVPFDLPKTRTGNLRKKAVLLVAFVLFSILAVRVFVLVRNGQPATGNSSFTDARSNYLRKLKEAEDLSGLNPARAVALVTESREAVNAQAKTCGNPKGKTCGEVSADLALVDTTFEKVLRIKKIENLGYFFDPGLVKEGAFVSSFSLSLGRAVLLDTAKNTVIGLAIQNKQPEILGGGAEILGAKKVVAFGDSGYMFLKDDGIYGAAAKTDKIKKYIERDTSWGEIVDMTSFGGNLYLLDLQNGQIWKYPYGDAGFSSIRGYFPADLKPDFSKAVSFAIDGSVWVLLADGQILRFTQGKNDSLSVDNIGEPFTNASSIYTDEGSKSVYILDSGKKRVIVFDKKGIYGGQYAWAAQRAPAVAGAQTGGTAFKSPVAESTVTDMEVTGMVVSEELKKILFLSRMAKFIRQIFEGVLGFPNIL